MICQLPSQLLSEFGGLKLIEYLWVDFQENMVYTVLSVTVQGSEKRGDHVVDFLLDIAEMIN